ATSELVKLPPTMPAGTYYFGCIVDPNNMAVELDEGNNALASATTVQVAPAALRITTQQLPDGSVGRPYNFRLVASGETTPSTWSIDTANGTLPAGLTLAADGTISGTPTTATVAAFTALATSGTRTAAARLV